MHKRMIYFIHLFLILLKVYHENMPRNEGWLWLHILGWLSVLWFAGTFVDIHSINLLVLWLTIRVLICLYFGWNSVLWFAGTFVDNHCFNLLVLWLNSSALICSHFGWLSVLWFAHTLVDLQCFDFLTLWLTFSALICMHCGWLSVMLFSCLHFCSLSVLWFYL